jgi:hypothetical protein
MVRKLHSRQNHEMAELNTPHNRDIEYAVNI